jgi:hypothetical protein
MLCETPLFTEMLKVVKETLEYCEWEERTIERLRWRLNMRGASRVASGTKVSSTKVDIVVNYGLTIVHLFQIGSNTILRLKDVTY